MKYSTAYCLMAYQCSEGHKEIIWNSRDGVTPFIIRCRKCTNNSQHVEWENDTYVPDHKPKKGDRVFIDLIVKNATKYRHAYVKKWWNTDMDRIFGSKENAIDKLVKNDLDEFSPPPDLIEVE